MGGGSSSTMQGGLPGVTSHVRTLDEPRQSSSSSTMDVSHSGCDLVANGLDTNGLDDASSRGTSDEKRVSDATMNDAEEANAAAAAAAAAAGNLICPSITQRDVNALNEPDRATRKRAMETIARALSQRSTQELVDVLHPSRTLLAPLLRALGDATERVRLVAAEAVLDALVRAPDAAAAALPQIVPMLAARIGAPEQREPSEEVREILSKIVAGPVLHTPAEAIASVADPIADITSRGMLDAYAGVKKLACEAAGLLVAAAPTSGVHPRVLDACITGALKHQHSKVRVAAVAVVEACVLCQRRDVSLDDMTDEIASAVMDDDRENLLASSAAPALHRVVTEDASPQVRMRAFVACARMVGAERAECPSAYAPVPSAAAPHVYPMLLLALTDEAIARSQADAARIAHLVDDAAAVWHKAQPETGPAGDGGIAGAPAPVSDMSDAGDALLPFDAEVATSSSSPSSSSSGWQWWPTPAARAMAVALLPKLLNGVLRTLREWTSAKRASGARSLLSLVALTRGDAAPHASAICPALAAAVADDDAGVAALVVLAARTLGTCCDPSHWLAVALERVASGNTAGTAVEEMSSTPSPNAPNEATVSAGRRAGALVALSSLLRGASVGRGWTPTDAQLSSLAATLAAAEVRGDSSNAVRTQMLSVAANACSAVAGSAAVSPLAEADLVRVLLQLRCASPAEHATGTLGGGARQGRDSALAGGASAALAQLGGGDEAVVLRRTAERVLCTVEPSCASWEATSPDACVFWEMLRSCPGDALASLAPRMLRMLETCTANADNAPAIRIAALRELDALAESSARGAECLAASVGDNVNRETACERAIRAVAGPALIWKVGKTAAAVRHSACVCLGTLLRVGNLDANVLGRVVEDDMFYPGAGKLLPLMFGAMDEDWYHDTRLAACDALESLVRASGRVWSENAKRATYPEITKRLDDANGGVRASAARLLLAFVEACCPNYDSTNVGYLVEGVLVHMDDADDAIAVTVCDALCVLAAHGGHSSIVVKAVSGAKERHRRVRLCEKVLQQAASA
ncbi:dynein axonemal assembly factor 5 [Pycnococcus provasolii]